MKAICHNGETVPAGAPLFDAGNRGFRYGDGVFETARVVDGVLRLAPLHFNRLFTALQLLQIRPGPQFTPHLLQKNILHLCRQNKCSHRARVRLAVYRQPGGDAGYVIETFPLGEDALVLNEKGWQLVVYPLARKSCDAFANLKSANYLPYVLAGAYAAEKGADEALVLNSYNLIADGSKTNLFLLKDGAWYTPALDQGCVAGVMRTHLLQVLKQKGFAVHQTAVTEEMLATADEVCCTNAVQGIRWVQRFGNREYSNTCIQQVFKDSIDEL